MDELGCVLPVTTSHQVHPDEPEGCTTRPGEQGIQYLCSICNDLRAVTIRIQRRAFVTLEGRVLGIRLRDSMSRVEIKNKVKSPTS